MQYFLLVVVGQGGPMRQSRVSGVSDRCIWVCSEQRVSNDFLVRDPRGNLALACPPSKGNAVVAEVL